MGKISTEGLVQDDHQSNHFKMKIFYFNKHLLKYQFTEPEDLYMQTFEPWGYEED